MDQLLKSSIWTISSCFVCIHFAYSLECLARHIRKSDPWPKFFQQVWEPELRSSTGHSPDVGKPPWSRGVGAATAGHPIGQETAVQLWHQRAESWTKVWCLVESGCVLPMRSAFRIFQIRKTELWHWCGFQRKNATTFIVGYWSTLWLIISF